MRWIVIVLGVLAVAWVAATLRLVFVPVEDDPGKADAVVVLSGSKHERLDRGLELWVMAEVPSITFWLDEYARQGIHGVSIGSNDLTQLMLGVDRDSEILAPLYDERDPAVLNAIHAATGTPVRRLPLRHDPSLKV